MTQKKNESQLNLDRPAELCFKRLIYRYLLETGFAPGDPLGVSWLVVEP